MESIMQITSAQNPKLKKLMKLKQKRERDREQVFLIEGYRETLRAQESDWEIEALFTCEALFLGSNEKALVNSIEAPKYALVEHLFRKISYRDRPDGILCLAKMRKNYLSDLAQYIKTLNNPFFIIAEAIEKPGNLGSILRSADATGCDGVIVANRCTDIYNPNVVRSSVGTLFSMPVFELENKEIYSLFSSEKIQMVAASPHTDLLYTEAPFTEPTAILVGTEQLGLSNFWMERANVSVKLPMLGKADSLNVANATTVLLYEVLRQRY